MLSIDPRVKRLHELTWHTADFMHAGWWQALELDAWQFRLQQSPALNMALNRLIRQRLAAPYQPLPAKLDARQEFMLDKEETLSRICTALGLVLCSCPDYLLTGAYRRYLNAHFGPEGCTQLLSLCLFAHPAAPTVKPEDLVNHASDRGVQWLNAQYFHCPVWRALSLTLSPAGHPEGCTQPAVFPWFYRFGRLL